jgi:hypothetical protein
VKSIDLDASRRRLLTLAGELRDVLRSREAEFEPESPAATDVRVFNDVEAVRGILGQAALLYESISDHVVAATRILQKPPQAIAPFSLVRGSVEVSSISCWILDPSLTPTERVARSFAFRRKGLDGQKAVIAEHPHTDDGALPGRYAYLDRKEQAYGVPRIQMPSATDLVGTLFGGRGHYRLTSAVVHGHPWAVSQVAFTRQDEAGIETESVFLDPTLKPDIVAYLLLLALDALARPFWFRTLYSGHDTCPTVTLLESTYDDMQIMDGRRFWRAG